MNTLKKIFAHCIGIFLIFTLAIGFINPTKGRLNGFVLPVPFVPQLATNWCWAACSQMVSTFIHSKNPNAPVLRQCDLAIEQYQNDTRMKATMSCPPIGKVPQMYDSAGFPFSPSHNYQQWFNMGALGWDQLCAKLRDSTPVVFQWQWKGVVPLTEKYSGSHYMVAVGYLTSKIDPSYQGVIVNDPWPVDTGRHQIIPYSEYANVYNFKAFDSTGRYQYYSHGWDYCYSYPNK